MKKYPVFYNGNTYEVRWTRIDTGWNYEEGIKVYHVIIKKFCGIRYKTYKYLCNVLLSDLNEILESNWVDKNSEDMYIEQAKICVYNAEKHIKKNILENTRIEKLSSWDGVVKFERESL